MRFSIAVVTMMAFGGLAAAQHQHGPTPYTGLEHRAIKALSEQQISDLQAGRGMGLALAAELNGYPGPLHVLELADQIELSDEQRQRVRQLYDAMKAEAVPVGETLIAHESTLDRAFAEGSISTATLTSLTAQIGETQTATRHPPEISPDDGKPSVCTSKTSIRRTARIPLRGDVEPLGAIL